jgi:hypothetical protein
MKTRLAQIRNSSGARIPRFFIDKFRLKGEIELKHSSKGLLIKSSLNPPNKWEDLFKASMIVAEKQNKRSKGKNISIQFDKEEWPW